MSRLYFHSPSGTAELRGSERAWLAHIAKGPASEAWNLDNSADSLIRAAQIIEMIPEPKPGPYCANHLHVGLRAALARKTRYHSEWHRHEIAGVKPMQNPAINILDPDADRKLIDSLKIHLRAGNEKLHVAGHDLQLLDVALNTALAAGSQPIQLAAKLDGACEQHCWVNGSDRAWLADIINSGLKTGVYRRGFWTVDRPCHEDPATQEDRIWSDQGWGGILELLRARDDEPVVCSYSVCDQFPNVWTAREGGWRPAPLPEDWAPDWATTDGRAEWNAMDAEAQDEYRREAFDTQWHTLPESGQWSTAMAGLRVKPWLQLTPESLAGTMFGPPVTIYDLLAPDRDTRVTAAYAKTS